MSELPKTTPDTGHIGRLTFDIRQTAGLVELLLTGAVDGPDDFHVVLWQRCNEWVTRSHEQQQPLVFHFERLTPLDAAAVSFFVRFSTVAAMKRSPIVYIFDPSVDWQKRLSVAFTAMTSANLYVDVKLLS